MSCLHEVTNIWSPSKQTLVLFLRVPGPFAIEFLNILGSSSWIAPPTTKFTNFSGSVPVHPGPESYDPWQLKTMPTMPKTALTPNIMTGKPPCLGPLHEGS